MLYLLLIFLLNNDYTTFCRIPSFICFNIKHRVKRHRSPYTRENYFPSHPSFPAYLFLLTLEDFYV